MQSTQVSAPSSTGDPDGACACRLVSGEVRMLNEVLEQEDLDDGIILACQPFRSATGSPSGTSEADMPIDPDVAIGASLPEVEFSWTASDVLLYHLAVGAGPDDLRYVLEDRLHVLPTFGVAATNLRTFEPPAVRFPGIEIDLTKVLHGTQSITLHHPIPPSGKAIAHPRISDVWDKEKAAIIVQETTVTDPSGNPLWTTTSSIYARGEGNFGGSRGPSTKTEPPNRPPDKEIVTPTFPQQALLYRLCGDRNPLHADPTFAAAAGFPRPILHGLCTWAMACKAVVDTIFDGDVTQVGTYAARFSGIIFPGETLQTKIWTEPNTIIVATSTTERGDDILLGSLNPID